MQLLLMSPLAHKLISAFSWMLIHSLWQGLLFSVITGIVLVFTKKASEARRYNLVLLLFATFLFTVGCTFCWEWGSAASKSIMPAIAGNIGTNVTTLLLVNMHTIKQLGKTFTGYFTANAPMVVLVWLVFFLFKSVKMMACMVYNRRIKSYKVYTPDLFWRHTVTTLSAKLGINKTVTLLQSGYVKMPVVLGHLKPIILIPASLLAGLPAEQVEAILLHELAHIRRNDYFINFLQNIAEAVFFFNPGLLWISALLREERENCCDDIALAQTQNKRGFVEALISFKEHEMYGANYATAFMGKKNYLLRRVTRIMQNTNKTFGFGERLFFMMSIVFLVVIIATTAVAQLKEYAKTEAIANSAKLADVTVTQPDNKPKIEASYFKAGAKYHRAKHTIRMIAGINGIPENEACAARGETIRSQEDDALAAERQEALLQKQYAEQGRAQAERDRAQAQLDQLQAIKDRAQADKDRLQAEKDRAQAVLDRKQGEIDRAQAVKDRQEAQAERAKDIKAKADADLVRIKN